MRSKRWQPADENLAGLLFQGAPALLRGLDNLILRPRRWWRDTLLPIIYLVCAPAHSSPLNGIADRLRQARGTLYSRINGRESLPASKEEPPDESIRRLLDSIVADLSQKSGRGRPLKFPHYSLAVWLESLFKNRTTPDQPDQSAQRVDNELQRFIRNRYQLRKATTSAEADPVNGFPWWIRLPVLVLPPLGIRLMRALWRPPRWAARNRTASKHSSGSFRGLARKLMEQSVQEHKVQQDDVDLLLVDAFMEDLRRSHRRTSLFGVGRRRTIYPVLLIDDIGPDTAGIHLLQLISDSRTETLRKDTAGPGRRPREGAYFHPLLIIAQGDGPGLHDLGREHYRPERHSTYSTADFRFSYDTWYRELADSDRTWFLPMEVPTEPPPGGHRDALIEIPLPDAPRPVMTFASVFLLIAAASFSIYSTYYTHCGAWYWEPQLERQALTSYRDQCVGLGSSNHRFFDSVDNINGITKELAGDLKEVEEKIHRTNELIVARGGYLTVAYLSELTSRDVADYRFELEQLRGIAVAQEANMEDRPVRILLANAGDGMNYGRSAAEAIAAEAKEDDTLVTVVGLGISRTGTRDAIIRLARPDTSIPTIGTVISATALATKTTPYYHQVGPTNQREAEVAAFYAANQLGARNVTIYYSGDDDDLYSNDLKMQAERSFAAHGMAVNAQPYRIDPGDDGGDISLVGRDACEVGPEGVVFYAGRAEQLSVFLKGMQTACEGSYPKFLGGDAVSRFVLDGGLKRFPGLTVDYLSLASSLAWGADCSGAFNRIGFFTGYQNLFGKGACTSTRDGIAILAHDTLLVFTQGVRNTQVDLPSPDAVLAGIEDISSEGEGPLRGASGQIDYPRMGDQSIPRDKTILVLRVEGSDVPERVLLCGQLDTAQPPPDDDECPPAHDR